MLLRNHGGRDVLAENDDARSTSLTISTTVGSSHRS